MMNYTSRVGGETRQDKEHVVSVKLEEGKRSVMIFSISRLGQNWDIRLVPSSHPSLMLNPTMCFIWKSRKGKHNLLLHFIRWCHMNCDLMIFGLKLWVFHKRKQFSLFSSIFKWIFSSSSHFEWTHIKWKYVISHLGSKVLFLQLIYFFLSLMSRHKRNDSGWLFTLDVILAETNWWTPWFYTSLNEHFLLF